jgi:hypothetical protein
MSITQMNENILRLVKNERKITGEILSAILQFSKCGGHQKMGYATMHQYLTRAVGYSDDQAHRRWKAAQLMDQLPDSRPIIQSGELNLSQAAATQKAIEQAQREHGQKVDDQIKKDIIASVKNLNNFKTQKVLAEKLNLNPVVDEKSKPQANKTVRVEFNLSEADYEKFLLVQSMLSHQLESQNKSDCVVKLLDLFLNKKMGLKNERGELNKSNATLESSERSAQNQNSEKLEIQEKNLNNNKSLKINDSMSPGKPGAVLNGSQKNPKVSRYVPVEIKRKLWNRSQGKCEFKHINGQHCESRNLLQIDHIYPYSFGGATELKNLRLLCAQCNQLSARQMGLGIETTSFF